MNEGNVPLAPEAVGLDHVLRSIVPLRMVFWGGLLCIFDITFSNTVNGEGFKFDVLNDAVGAGLIAWGVLRLHAMPVHARYAKAMMFVSVVAILAVIEAVWDHFIVEVPTIVSVLLFVFGLAKLAAIVTFSVAMRWFCLTHRMDQAAESWKTTTFLFILIYLIPLGLFYLIAVGAVVMGQSFNVNLGPVGLLLLPIFAIPVVHLFVSTSRMKRSAQAISDQAAGRPAEGGGQ